MSSSFFFFLFIAFVPFLVYSKHGENIYTPFHIYPLVRDATLPKTLVSARADCTPSGH